MRFFLGHYVKLLSRSSDLFLFSDYSFWGVCKRAKLGPAINFSHDGLNWKWQTSDHLTYSSTIRPYVGKKVLFMTRYALDVLVSNWAYFHHLNNGQYQGNLETFIQDPVHSLKKYIKFHNLWASHQSEFSDLNVLRYEDIRKSPTVELPRLLAFLGFEFNQQYFYEALEFSSLENMRKMQEDPKNMPFLRNPNRFIREGNKDDLEARHVRKGKVGGYREYLDPKLATHLENIIASELDPMFGYQTPVSS